MRLQTLVAVAVGLAAAGCGSTQARDELQASATGTATAASARATTYPGDIGTPRCTEHWYTGFDDIATVTCDKDAYRIAFAVSGQEVVRPVVGEADWMTVDAVVRGRPADLVLDPGIGCFTAADHGWIAMLGNGSAYGVVPYGGSEALVQGTSRAIHRLSKWNHIVLTCDARGSATKITLRVNGTVVVRNREVGDALPLDRFGVFAAGEAGATLELRAITATTR